MVPELADESFGVVMASDRPVFAERALYSNASTGVLGGGQRRDGDAAAVARSRCRLPGGSGGPLSTGGAVFARTGAPPPFSSQRACPAEEETFMRNRILCAAVLAAAHAATAGAQPAPAPLPAGDGWVALTIADYLKLRDQANPRPAPPPPPPARATVSETAYELTAGDGLATGTAELAIDVLDDGWVEVPLPASLFVRAARLGGRPLAIADGRHGGAARRQDRGRGSGTRRILLSRKGRSLVTLDVAVPIVETAGNEHIQLPPATGGLVARDADRAARRRGDRRRAAAPSSSARASRPRAA